jgi:hypothetical protein
VARIKRNCTKVSKKAARIAINQRSAMTPEAVKQYEEIANPAPDFKCEAANDDTETTTETTPKTPTEVSANRKEGLRLWVLAGKPKPEDFIAVYGPKGPKMTWDQRAEKGIAAERFQEALAFAHRLVKMAEPSTPAPAEAPAESDTYGTLKGKVVLNSHTAV